jgi:NADPH-dependent curcumin reductase CurA
MLSRGWIVAKASRGVYSPDCLSWQERSVPELRQGQVLVKTNLLSLDPTSRNWLKLESHAQYLPIKIGDVMLGVGIGEVLATQSLRFAVGDLVTGMWGWEEYSVASQDYLERVTLQAGEPLESYLSVFSHVGRAAAIGLHEIGRLNATDEVLISGAAGATGGLAAQIAKANGNRVVGIAGGQKKCDALLSELHVDHAIDYKMQNVEAEIARLFPKGVDVFFDNVGGQTLDAVLAHMAIGCRIVICGAISQYDLADHASAYGCKNLPLLVFRQGRIEGFVVPQLQARMAEFDAILHRLYAEGKLKNRAHIVEGLENAPTALKMLFAGENDGKLMIKVGNESRA